MMAGMLLQTLYFFVDLYFVSRLGDAAIAGVSAASSLTFAVFFLTQAISVGTVALVAQAVGRKDREAANHAFNQAVGMGALLAVVTIVGGYLSVDAYARFFASDEAARVSGRDFLLWYLPGMAFQFASAVLVSGLRGTGIVKPAMLVQIVTVVLNAILAPILVAGWGTGKPLGVAGAGLATTLAVVAGVAMLVVYFVKLEHYVTFDRSQWRPKWATWKRLFNVGLPAGGEFGVMAIFAGVLYWAARGFGTPAQGGIGIGFRVNQMVFIPALAIAFAAAPIAGQNFGARHGARVRETFRVAVLYCAVFMGALSLLAQLLAEPLVGVFTAEPEALAVGVTYVRWMAWAFVPVGITMCASSVMQGMGNTWPAFLSSVIRIGTFALPTVWLAAQPWFGLRHMYALSIATILLQAAINCLWLRRELRLRLAF
jgi:putative MATE family efflux protein